MDIKQKAGDFICGARSNAQRFDLESKNENMAVDYKLRRGSAKEPRSVYSREHGKKNASQRRTNRQGRRRDYRRKQDNLDRFIDFLDDNYTALFLGIYCVSRFENLYVEFFERPRETFSGPSSDETYTGTRARDGF